MPSDLYITPAKPCQDALQSVIELFSRHAPGPLLKIWIPADPDQFAANKDAALWGFVMDLPAEARGIVADPPKQNALLPTPVLVAVNSD